MEKWTLENIMDPPLHRYISSTLTCNWHHFLRTHNELLGFFSEGILFMFSPFDRFYIEGDDVFSEGAKS